jgi:hypothetical protein
MVLFTMAFIQMMGVFLGSAGFVVGIMLRADSDARKRGRPK